MGPRISKFPTVVLTGLLIGLPIVAGATEGPASGLLETLDDADADPGPSADDDPSTSPSNDAPPVTTPLTIRVSGWRVMPECGILGTSEEGNLTEGAAYIEPSRPTTLVVVRPRPFVVSSLQENRVFGVLEGFPEAVELACPLIGVSFGGSLRGHVCCDHDLPACIEANAEAELDLEDPEDPADAEATATVGVGPIEVTATVGT